MLSSHVVTQWDIVKLGSSSYNQFITDSVFKDNVKQKSMYHSNYSSMYIFFCGTKSNLNWDTPCTRPMPTRDFSNNTIPCNLTVPSTMCAMRRIKVTRLARFMNTGGDFFPEWQNSFCYTADQCHDSQRNVIIWIIRIFDKCNRHEEPKKLHQWFDCLLEVTWENNLRIMITASTTGREMV